MKTRVHLKASRSSSNYSQELRSRCWWAYLGAAWKAEWRGLWQWHPSSSSSHWNLLLSCAAWQEWNPVIVGSMRPHLYLFSIQFLQRLIEFREPFTLCILVSQPLSLPLQHGPLCVESHHTMQWYLVTRGHLPGQMVEVDMLRDGQLQFPNKRKQYGHSNST